MTFKRVEFNTTKQIPEKGMISGRRNTLFLRNKYQTELDNANAAVVHMVHYCEDKMRDYTKLKKAQ